MCYFAVKLFELNLVQNMDILVEFLRLILARLNTSFEHDTPRDFFVSQWQTKDKSLCYVIYRWIVAIFFGFSVATSIVFAILRNQAQTYIIYLTNWNLTFTMITTGISAWYATKYFRGKCDIKEKMTRNLKVLWFLSSTTTMFASLVTVIYWTILFKHDKAIDLNNILIHATNSLVLIIDLCIVKHPGRFGIYLYSLICGLAYLFFSWLYPFLGGLNK